MNALAECAAHAFGKKDGGFAKFVAKPVGGGERPSPFVSFLGVDQLQLFGHIVEVRSMYSQQTDGAIALPIVEKQLTHSLEDLGIDAGRTGEGVGASDRGEV